MYLGVWLKIVARNIGYGAASAKRIVAYVRIQVWRIRNNITLKYEAWLFENRPVLRDRTKRFTFDGYDNTYNSSVYT